MGGGGWGLTGLVPPERLVGLVPKRPAVLLQLEEAALLPGPGANLDQLAAHKQELQVGVALQTWREAAHRGQVTDITSSGGV